ncbi:uncharacterized protein LOC108915189 isoform X2 [Anoplophora glabripennis]|uniref:uncharacterized protein LOC108915189 isoform X2 n=1 Tax=Anoplophora glabripennis TaxID=217634 RepID=UPI00087496F3|nr:uncharacterized protein LOC108915189 isoform X2 [Anoplophora glabripennis]
MYRYEFFKENEEHLLQFLQAAKVRNKKYCNLMEHQTLSQFLPDFNLQADDLNRKGKYNVIDLTSSDEEESFVSNFKQAQINLLDVNTNIKTVNDFTADDMLHLIKEHLQTEEKLSILPMSSVICNQQKIFSLLSKLEFEEVLNFGTSLMSLNICSDSIISYYIRYLLLEKLIEYSDQLQQLLNDFSIKFSENVLEELTQSLLQKGSYSKVFLQFVDGLNMDFKEKLLRKLVFTCEKFQDNYFPVIELLIVPQIEFDTLNRLFEILSNSENNLNTDKSFGKFLMNLMILLGNNLLSFEQPLKHLIGSHRSIWKAKLQKKIDDCLQENSILSQSIRIGF